MLSYVILYNMIYIRVRWKATRRKYSTHTFTKQHFKKFKKNLASEQFLDGRWVYIVMLTCEKKFMSQIILQSKYSGIVYYNINKMQIIILFHIFYFIDSIFYVINYQNWANLVNFCRSAITYNKAAKKKIQVLALSWVF